MGLFGKKQNKFRDLTGTISVPANTMETAQPPQIINPAMPLLPGTAQNNKYKEILIKYMDAVSEWTEWAVNEIKKME